MKKPIRGPYPLCGLFSFRLPVRPKNSRREAVSDIDDAIRESMQGPRRASGDNGSVEQHSLDDQIKAAKYLARSSSTLRSDPNKAIKFSKITNPGAQ